VHPKAEMMNESHFVKIHAGKSAQFSAAFIIGVQRACQTVYDEEPANRLNKGKMHVHPVF
jgi:hypothetical protein